MTIKRRILQGINNVLSFANLRIDSLTFEQREVARLDEVAKRDCFKSPCYPIPPSYPNHEAGSLLEALPKYKSAMERLRHSGSNKVGYELDNPFYSSPDMEILYTLVSEKKPRQILEIGCGNSTRITRQAILDGALSTKLTCIDPFPRRDVSEFADELHLCPVETSPALELVRQLKSGDILFIDTSHELHPANDCAYIYCVLLPEVPSGVIVHIHDIFLPFEYPESFVRGDARHWGEQYLVSVLLQNESAWGTIWPGHYLQRTMAGFREHFPLLGERPAQSLWLRRL